MTNPSSNFMDSMKAAAMKGKDLAAKKLQGAITSVGTHMTIPMIKKFREDLTKQISNKTEWEKRPREDREAIFNEIKAISKLFTWTRRFLRVCRRCSKSRFSRSTVVRPRRCSRLTGEASTGLTGRDARTALEARRAAGVGVARCTRITTGAGGVVSTRPTSQAALQ